MIRVETRSKITRVILDRAAARNAITIDGWHALAAAFVAIPSDTAVVLLVSAVPGSFSAGADLGDLARLADYPGERPKFRQAMRNAIEALAALPMPSIAAIDGGCFGAAVALVLAADIRIAGEGARFAVPPARLGIAYPADDVARLASRIGQGQSARLLFTAEVVDAAEALRIGLVDLIADADALAGQVSSNDLAALLALKAMLRNPSDPAHASAFERSFASHAFRTATERYRQ